jgi:hypothetical protein
MQLFLAAIYRGKGKEKESIECMEKFYRYSNQPEGADSLHRAFESGGVKAAIEWQIRFNKASAGKHYVPPVSVAELYAQLGDREQTLAQLEEAFQQHSSPLLWIQSDSAYDFLHADPRYRSLPAHRPPTRLLRREISGTAGLNCLPIVSGWNSRLGWIVPVFLDDHRLQR